MFKTLSVNKILSSLFSLIQKSIYIMQLVNHTCVYEWGMRKKKNNSFAKWAVYVYKEIHKLQWLFWTSDSRENHPPVIETSEDENPRVNPIDSSIYTQSILNFIFINTTLVTRTMNICLDYPIALELDFFIPCIFLTIHSPERIQREFSNAMIHPSIRIVLTSKRGRKGERAEAKRRDTLTIGQCFISFKRENSERYKTTI